MKRPRRLTCACCGESTLGRQWWNRDTGFGLCASCIPLCQRGETPESFEQSYGKRGIHFDLPSDVETTGDIYAANV